MKDYVRLIYDHAPWPLQNLFCTAEGARLRRLRYGRGFRKRLEFLEESIGWPLADLETYQLQELRRLLRFADRYVPHYRRVFKSTNVLPSDFTRLEQLAQFPVLEKETIRFKSRELLPDNRSEIRVFKGRTSGTTGTSLPIYYSKDALVEEFATVWRLRKSVGMSMGKLHATFNGRRIVPLQRRRRPYWRINRASYQYLLSQYHIGPSTIGFYVDLLVRTPFSYWEGYPSFMVLAANGILDQGIQHWASPPVAIFPSSESLSNQARAILRSATGAIIRDRYGTGEYAVSMTECAMGRLHVDMEMGIVEVEERGRDASTVWGPILVTGLQNYGMPLIRYRIGDFGTMYLDQCACGRAGQTFQQIDGRIEDYVVTAEGNYVGRLDHVFKDLLSIREAQIVQHEEGRIHVKVVQRPDFSLEDEKRLRKELAKRLGSSMLVDIEYVEQIPRLPNGKFRAVVSLLKQRAQNRGF